MRAQPFDNIIDRRNTASWKWDKLDKVFGTSDLLPMWIADMDFAAPPAVVEAVKAKADHGIYGYATFPRSFYEAITGWMKRRHNWDVKGEWIMVTPGVVPAISIAVQAFTAPGDGIVIQPPVYPPFFRCVKANRRRLVENPLKFEEGQYRIDFDDLERKLDPTVKMLILCNPHNPVGRVWPKEDLIRLTEICIKHNLLILADEIHGDLIFTGHRHIPLATLGAEVAERTVTFTAPSKTFNLAGLYTSATIISNPALRQRFNELLEVLSVNEGNVFGIAACEAAYNHGEAWLSDLLAYLEESADFLIRYLSERMPQVKAVRPEATYLAWLDFRELGLDSAELRRFLIYKAKVGLNDGTTFGTQGEGFARLNFGCPRSLLAEGLTRIEKAIKG
ncbi:MAG: PatB family C-S lyase [Negativicutes bacterium]|nr:PatB family C-S lyase [Negativicutes bacterium]